MKKSILLAALVFAMSSAAHAALITRHVITEQSEITGTVQIDTTLGQIVWADLTMPSVRSEETTVWMPGHVSGAGTTYRVSNSTLNDVWFPLWQNPAPATAWISETYASGEYTARVGLIFQSEVLLSIRDDYDFALRFNGRLPSGAGYPLTLSFRSFIYGYSPNDSSSPYHPIGTLSVVPEPSGLVLFVAATLVLLTVRSRSVLMGSVAWCHSKH